jgi:hypothetical protein
MVTGKLKKWVIFKNMTLKNLFDYRYLTKPKRLEKCCFFLIIISKMQI